MPAVIGGSGLYSLIEPRSLRRLQVETPFGEPSAPIEAGRLHSDGPELYFLARHGPNHSIAPHRVNYRANLWALREVGAGEVFTVNSVGSLRREWEPGSLVIPDQLIDYTWGREQTFSGPEDPIPHLDFSEPYSPGLRARMLAAALTAGSEVIDGATYGCTQGPRFETPAEIRRMARDGCDLVGMTAMPEAILARELGLGYCAICVVGNLAAGLIGPGQVLDHQVIAAASRSALAEVQRILGRLFQQA